MSVFLLLMTSLAVNIKLCQTEVLYKCNPNVSYALCNAGVSDKGLHQNHDQRWNLDRPSDKRLCNSSVNIDHTTRPSGQYFSTYLKERESPEPPILFISQLQIKLSNTFNKTYTNVQLHVTFILWGNQGNTAQLSLFENSMMRKHWSSKSTKEEEWRTEVVSLLQAPYNISFESGHNSSNTCSGVGIDEIIITADPVASTAMPASSEQPPQGDEQLDNSAMELLIILLICTVGFLVLIIILLVFILLRRKREGEFKPGITVANSTYDIPATISGINTSENQYFKYGTYSGERFPPVSPSSDIQSPIVKFPKKKRKGLTLPMRTSQAVGTFDYKGMSPMSSPSPQSPESGTRLYVQKRPKLGLLGRAQAMIYGSPKPMSKRLSRSLPDNLEWTLSGYARGPYQITDLLNGRIELKDDPPVMEQKIASNGGDREQFIKNSPLSPPKSPTGRFDPHRENGNTNPPQNEEDHPAHQPASPNQHVAINLNFKERTLDRSALTLPLNVKRPSWDADKYQVIFDSGEGQCELLDLLQDSSQPTEGNVPSKEYENVGQNGSAVSRNNNRRSSQGNSSKRSSSRQDVHERTTPTKQRQTQREEFYEIVSPINDKDDLKNSWSEADPKDVVATSSSQSGGPSPEDCKIRNNGPRPTLKKKPQFKIEKRRVSFSNKTSIIDRPSEDEYDDVAVDVREKNDTANPVTRKAMSFHIKEEPTSNVGYVNVESSKNNTNNLSEVKEWEEPPSEYEMISPTDDEIASESINVYDKLAREFPLKKNPRSKKAASSSDAYNKLAMMPDVVQVASKDGHRLSGGSDYDNVESPVSTLRSPEGEELALYHFTPQSPQNKTSPPTGTGNDDYEMVG